MRDVRSSSHPPRSADDDRRFLGRVGKTLGCAALLSLLVALVWFHASVLFVLFGAYLFAVVLFHLGEWVSARTPLGRKTATAAILLFSLVVVASATFALGHTLNKQFGGLFEDLPRSVDSLRAKLQALPWARPIVGTPKPDDMQKLGEQAAKKAPMILSGLSESLGFLVVWFFVGVYGAFDPAPYRKGVLALVAPRHRVRASELMREISQNLFRWVLGRTIAMVVCGVMSVVGLHLLKIPMATALGILAGVLTFVDYAGAIVSAVPPILVALPMGGTHAVWVVGLYVVIHIVEGYLLAPYIMRKAVHLPAALTLAMQAILGSVFGIMGLTFAVPLTVVGLLVVKRLYVQPLEDTKLAEAA